MGVVDETQSVFQRPTQMAADGVLGYLCAAANFLRQHRLIGWGQPAGRPNSQAAPSTTSQCECGWPEAGMERTHVLSRYGHRE